MEDTFSGGHISAPLPLTESESAHPVGSPGESGTSGWQGGGARSPLCLLPLLLLPILRLLRVL